MRILRFTSRNGSKVLGLLFSVLTLSSCYSGTIWHIDQRRFQADLQAGRYDFLKEIDYSRVNLADVTRLGPNAPFYLSYVYRKIGMLAQAERMLNLEWQRGSGLWQKEAAKVLIKDYMQSSNFAAAEEVAKAAYSSYPTWGFYRSLVEAWYWQRKDTKVLAGLPRLADFRNKEGAPIVDNEVPLIRAVSSQRLDKPGWQKLFVDLFTQQLASDYHIRAYEYLNLPENAGAKATLSANDLALIEAKYYIAKQDFGHALRKLAPLIEKKDPLLMTPADLIDLGHAYIGSGAAYQGARVFTNFVSSLLANGAAAPSLYAAYELEGDLYRTAGYYDAAISAYQSALGYTETKSDYDRTLWYLLQTAVERSPSGAVSFVEKYAKLWHRPSYFDDVLGELCTDLVERHDWRGIWQTYRALEGLADGFTLSRYAYVVSEAIRTGYLVVPDAQSVEHDLLQKIVDLNVDPYYTVLASARLGITPPVLAEQTDPVGVLVTAPGENTDWENLAIGFLAYGLDHEAYTAARARLHSMGDGFLHTLALELAKRGDTIESMRLMDVLAARPTYTLTPEDLKLLYPDAFSSLIRDVAKRNGISIPVFYAMVRVESYFDPTIVSSAGAIGLTQLMPSTAADYARRMGLKDANLTHAATNLAIGGRYLKWLVSTFDNVGQALFAYNAGFTRVERWREKYGNLPSDLFLEAVPYPETRDYGKQILVSAVVYGYLYAGLTAPQVIREILPKF